MARVLIIGFGNTLRSDDAVGSRVAEQLKLELPRENVVIISAQQLTPEMAEAASQSDRLLFIDAAHDGIPGAIGCQQVHAAASPGRFTHELSPASLLQLALELYGRAPGAQLFTVAGKSFETGEQMSDEVRDAIPELIARIRSEVM